MRHMKKLAVAGLISMAGIVVLGCGSPVATTKSRGSPSSTTSPDTSTAAKNPPTSTSSTVATSQVSGQCTAGQLHPSWFGQVNGASGNLFYVINFRNASSSVCITGGYVGVSAYDPAGFLITASESRNAMGTTSPPTLKVAPYSTIHFVVGFSDVNRGAGGTACSTVVGALHLIPPNEKTEVQIATPISSGYPNLCGSTFLVGPLLVGAGGG